MRSSRKLWAVLSAAVAGLVLAACSPPGLEAPTDVGVCWHLVKLNTGAMRFNKLAANVPNLETCAARLEDMRLRFLRLGSNQREVTGAYQGQFLFLQREGVFTAASLNTTPYLALVRTPDGRLAIPGAVRQQ